MIANYNITVQDLERTTQESDGCPSFWLWKFNLDILLEAYIQPAGGVSGWWFNIHISGVKE